MQVTVPSPSSSSSSSSADRLFHVCMTGQALHFLHTWTCSVIDHSISLSSPDVVGGCELSFCCCQPLTPLGIPGLMLIIRGMEDLCCKLVQRCPVAAECIFLWVGLHWTPWWNTIDRNAKWDTGHMSDYWTCFWHCRSQQLHRRCVPLLARPGRLHLSPSGTVTPCWVPINTLLSALNVASIWSSCRQPGLQDFDQPAWLRKGHLLDLSPCWAS